MDYFILLLYYVFITIYLIITIYLLFIIYYLLYIILTTSYIYLCYSTIYYFSILLRYLILFIFIMFSSLYTLFIIILLYFYIISTNSYISPFIFSNSSLLLFILIFYISSTVIMVTIDYLSIMESITCILLIYSFIISMLLFIWFNSILFIFISWDWLGIISYFCINYWSSKIRSGIKAMLFNKIGDILFIWFISYYYAYGILHIIYSMDSCSLFILFILFIIYSLYGIIHVHYGLVVIYYYSYFLSSIYIMIIIIICTKSAQYPFFSWLLSAMLAPTPISSLLHSSTMVISGIWLGLVIDSILIILINILYWYFIIFLYILIISLLWSLFKGISSIDIKSIIAYSTISQISYMFLILLFIPHYVLFHIIIHGVFKSLLFLVSGSLIHVQLSFQSIYIMRISNISIRCSFIMGSSLLIGTLSKEYIINTSLYLISSSFIFIIYSIGGLFTLFYSINLYYFIFILFNYGILFDYYHYSSFIFIWYAISCIFIDQCFNCIFSICSLYSLFLGNIENIFYSSVLFWCYGFISIFFNILCLFCILFYIYIYHLDYALYYNKKYWYLYNYLFDSYSSFIISIYGLYLLLVIALYIFIPLIYIMELFVGIDGNSIYIFVYYHFSLIIWSLIIYLWIMVFIL